MTKTYDIAIVGSGFGGSLLAMTAKKSGRSVVLIEKSQHPRFVIGESSTPLANLMLEQLCIEYDLPSIRPLCKWGSWQKEKPEIPVGLKRGFSYFHHDWDQPFEATGNHDNELLVAASPHNQLSDTHWYRPDFDHYLVKEAQKTGVDYFDQTEITSVDFGENDVVLQGVRGNTELKFKSKVMVDASGQRGFLYHQLNLDEAPIDHMPPTQGIYAHFRGLKSWEHQDKAGNETPYPVDGSAIHHLFEGGWFWILHFNNGITSAGLSLRDDLAQKYQLNGSEAAWNRVVDHFPSVKELFDEAEPITPFYHLPSMQFRSAQIAGDRWAMLPAAACFVDPMMSTGFPVNLLGIQRLSEIFSNVKNLDNPRDYFANYARQTSHGIDDVSLMIAALYRNFSDFRLFTALSKLYFTAASYSETMIRLGYPDRAQSFLLFDHPEFGPQARDCYHKALKDLDQSQRKALIEQIYKTIEPFDVAGLEDLNRKNYYPALAEDILENADKLKVGRDEIEESLKKTGFILRNQNY